MNHYATLGVARDATEDEIRAAFRRLAYLHPDQHPGDPTAAARFARITSAYACLSNADTRARYDRLPSGNVGQVTDAVDLVTEIVEDAKNLDRRAGLRVLDRIASPEGRQELRGAWQSIRSLLR